MSDQPVGWFVDWESKLRPTDNPGKGLRCEVDRKAKYVQVLNKYDMLDHESTWYPDEAAVIKAGLKVEYADLTAPIKIGDVK
jgi:hypothetical protein